MALAIRAGRRRPGDDLAIASVIRLRPGVFSDAWFARLARHLRPGRLRAAGGVGRVPAHGSIAGRTVYVGTCAGDAHDLPRPPRRPTAHRVDHGGSAPRRLRRARDGRACRSSLRPDDLVGARPVRAPRGSAAELPRLGAGGGAADAHEQPRSRRSPRTPTTSWSTAGPAAPRAAGPPSTRSSASSARSRATRRCSSSRASRSASCGRTRGRRGC